MSQTPYKRLVLLTIMLIALISVIVVFLSKPGKSKPVLLDTSNQPTIGAAAAPVQIIVFEDLKCPGCRDYTLKFFPKLKTKYIDSGKVKYTTLMLSFIPGSRVAANAIYCAYAQDPKFFYPYVEKIFQKQMDEKANWATVTQLLKLAQQVPGINQQQLHQCMDDDRYVARLDENSMQAERVNLTTTPALLINGVLVSPANEHHVYEVIDEQVAAAQAGSMNVAKTEKTGTKY